MKSSNVLSSTIDFILDSLFEKQKKVFNEGLEKIVNQNRLLSDKSYSAYGFVYKGNLYVLKSVLEYVPSYLNKKTVPQLDSSLYDQIELLLKNQDKKENDRRKIKMYLTKYGLRCESISELFALVPKDVCPDQERTEYCYFLNKKELEEKKKIEELIYFYLGMNFIL